MTASALTPIPGDIVRHVAREPGRKTHYYVVTGEYLGGVDLRSTRPNGGGRGFQTTTPASLDDVYVARTNWALRLFRILLVIEAAAREQARRTKLAPPAPTPAQHSCDEDCALFLVDGECTACGTWHTETCAACGGNGFHRDHCEAAS